MARKLYIEDKVLTAILKQATLIVEADQLEELIRKHTTNPRQSDVDKKCETIRIHKNVDGLIQIVGSGTNDFEVQRIPVSLESVEDNNPEKLD